MRVETTSCVLLQIDAAEDVGFRLCLSEKALRLSSDIYKLKRLVRNLDEEEDISVRKDYFKKKAYTC